MSSTLTKWLLFTVKHSGEESYWQQSIIWFLSTASWIQTITNISAEGLYRGSIKTHLISSILHVVSVTLETVAGPRWLRPTQRFRFLGKITTITTLYIKFKGCKCKHTNLNCYSNLQNWLLILICKILEIFSKINPTTGYGITVQCQLLDMWQKDVHVYKYQVSVYRCTLVHHNQLTVHQLTWSGVRNAPTDFGTMYDSRTAEGQTVKADINFYQGSWMSFDLPGHRVMLKFITWIT